MYGKCFYIFILCGTWIFPNFLEAKFDIFPSKPIPEEFLDCDNFGLTSHLEALKTANEFLKLRFGIMQLQLDKQKDILETLNDKFEKITSHIQTMENKILKENQEHHREVSDMLNKQNQMMESGYLNKMPAVDDIHEMLLKHHILLQTFGERFDEVEKVLNAESFKNPTQELDDKISKKFLVLQDMDNKLTVIEEKAATKENQIVFNRNLQNYISKNEIAKICVQGEDQKLICTTETYPSSCLNFNEKHCSNNKCRIYNHHLGPDPFLVSCEEKAEGGGWTIIQRRINGSVDFYRDWSEYKNGFGHIDGEFFIGLDKLHALTTTLKPVELLIQLQEFNDTMTYIKYDEFEVGNETENYKLTKFGKYTGSAGDCLGIIGANFTTKDRDNDEKIDGNCANSLRGGWWFKKCGWSNINGVYYNSSVNKNEDGIFWCYRDSIGYSYSLKFVQMLIRPKRL